MQADKRVGIVGAGPAGLMAARYALMHGFHPCLFEKNSGIGGVWNADDGAVWESMTTNLSKYTCCFKDHPWPQGTPIFPPSKQMTAYIESYALKHDISKYIKFNCTVTNLARAGQGYQIEYNYKGKHQRDEFRFVVVASGIFLYPNLPHIEGMETFTGKITHSKTYRRGQDFSGKKVLVIGGSFTGIQLVGDLSKHSAKTVHSFHNDFWVLPHYLPIGPPSSEGTPSLPIDFFYNRKFYEFQSNQNVEAARQGKNKFYSVICKDQQEIAQLAIPQEKWKKANYVTISSSYIQQVKTQKIMLKKSDVAKIQGPNVYFNDGSQDNFDEIIFCTGYKSSLNFLSSEIKEIIQFKEDDRLQPVILYQEAYHPKLDNLFFVGVYKGPYFAVLELQTQLAFNHFIGKSNLPSAAQIQEGLQKERSIRLKIPREQFPHNDYIRFADDIASVASKNYPIKEFLHNQNVDAGLKDRFKKMNVFPCFPQAFTLENLQKQILESAALTKQTVLRSKL